MISKLRLTFGILLSGFIISGAFEAYTYINHNYPLPYASSIFIIGPFITFAGILTLWIGRSNWDEPLRLLFRLAENTFGLNILAILVALIPVVWYGFGLGTSIPSWVVWGFGAAIAASLLFDFAIYVLVAIEITSYFGKALLLIAFGWASVVCIWIASALAQKLGTIVLIVQNHTWDFKPVLASISGIESYLAVTYVLLSIAYLDVYHRSRAIDTKSSSNPGAPPAQ